jgi:hypothetical protein
MTLRWLHVIAIISLVGTTTAKADDKNSVPLPRDQWPATIYLDVQNANCESMGGKLQGKLGQSQVCYIASTDCESHAGFKVVTRDAYKIGSARLIACHNMQ